MSYLKPSETLPELFAGLVVVLTVTLAASVLGGADEASATTALIGAIGANAAWGIIDAAHAVRKPDVRPLLQQGARSPVAQPSGLRQEGWPRPFGSPPWGGAYDGLCQSVGIRSPQIETAIIDSPSHCYVCDALQASKSKKCRSVPDQRHKGVPESAILLVFTASA